MEIDLFSEVPSYLQLADKLRAAIQAGEYRPHEPVPSIKALHQETGLAVETIRKAVKVLRDEGLVRIVPGRGTFVTERPEPGG